MENGEFISANVPILGQLQVGKSSLFSRLVHGRIKEELLLVPKQRSILHDEFGIEIPRGIRFIEEYNQKTEKEEEH